MRRNGFVLSNKNIITHFAAVQGLRERHKTESSPILRAKAENETGLRVLRSRVALSQSAGVCLCVSRGVQSETAECLHSTAAKQTEINSN